MAYSIAFNLRRTGGTRPMLTVRANGRRPPVAFQTAKSRQGASLRKAFAPLATRRAIALLEKTARSADPRINAGEGGGEAPDEGSVRRDAQCAAKCARHRPGIETIKRSLLRKQPLIRRRFAPPPSPARGEGIARRPQPCSVTRPLQKPGALLHPRRCGAISGHSKNLSRPANAGFESGARPGPALFYCLKGPSLDRGGRANQRRAR